MGQQLSQTNTFLILLVYRLIAPPELGASVKWTILLSAKLPQ